MGVVCLSVGLALALVAVFAIAFGRRRRCPILASCAVGAFLAYAVWPFDTFLVFGSTAAALAWFWMSAETLRPGAP